MIPAEINTTNKSPVLYQEHSIGLESWCIQHVYRYAYMELMEVRSALAKRRLSYTKGSNLNHFLIGTLLINPDVSTFWNMKKELVEIDVLAADKELIFAKIILSYKSKSNEAFSYRRWLLKRFLSKTPQIDQNFALTLLQNEMSVCEMAAEKSPNNYHAWNHRIWTIENVAEKIDNFKDVILGELDFSSRWIKGHVSEHTSYHYRQFLFDLVKTNSKITSIYHRYYNQVIHNLNLDNEDDPACILVYLLGKSKSVKSVEENIQFVNYFSLLLFDLVEIIDLNAVFSNHESIYYHRRYLLYKLLKTAHEYHEISHKMRKNIYFKGVGNIVDSDLGNNGEKQPKLFKSQPNKVESSFLYNSLVKSESDFVKQNLNSGYSGFELAKRYEKWLKYVFGFDFVS